MNSRYFYIDDNGRVKKYIYCSRGCFEPYKQEDLGTLIYRANEHTCICKKCISTLGMKSDELLKKENKEFVDDIEVFQDVNFVEEKTDKSKNQIYDKLLEELKDITIESKKNKIKKETKIDEKVEDSIMIDEDDNDEKESVENDLDKLDEEVKDVIMIDEDENINNLNEKTKNEHKKEIEEDQTGIIVFVCQCKDKTYYCGITANLKNAIKYHNQGCGGSYTKPKERRPVVLVESKEVSSQEEAKKIKKEMIEKYK